MQPSNSANNTPSDDDFEKKLAALRDWVNGHQQPAKDMWNALAAGNIDAAKKHRQVVLGSFTAKVLKR